MVDVLHQNGIAVFLDIVWNHLGPSDNYLWFYDGGQIYFDTPDVQTPWGSQPDFTRDQVRRYFLDSALLWLDEYRLDGFRMDATEYMNIPPQEAEGWSLMQALNNQADRRAIDKYIFAEQLPDDPWITRPTALGGAGFDGQLHDYFVDTLRQEIFDAAFGDPEMFKIADILDGSGQYLEKAYVVNYLGSHDEAWPSSGGQRIVKTIDGTPPHDSIFAKGRLKLAAGVTLFAQGVPMLFYGDEWGEIEDFSGGGNGGGGGRIDWSRKLSHGNTFRFFRDAVGTRRENGALRADAGIQTFLVGEANNIVAWQRFDNDGNLLVIVANFSNNNFPAFQLGLPQPGTWYELLNSQHTKYDGNGLINTQVEASGAPRHGFNQSTTIQLPQMGLLVFRHNVPPVVEPCPIDISGNFTIDLDDLLLVLGTFGVPGGEGDVDVDGDVDLDDLLLVLGSFGQLCP
jgi:1,4-alpha-glucan branching enzyme